MSCGKWLIVFFFSAATLFAQWSLSAAMGLDFKSNPSYRDYINSGFAPMGNKLSSFSSSVNFAGEADYELNESYQIGFEYSIQLDSYNTQLGFGLYEITLTLHRPSVIGYYVLKGNGFKFEFGAGIGPRFANLTEQIIVKNYYYSAGVGFLIKADANTMLGTNLFALIGIDLRYDLAGEPEDSNNRKIINYGLGEPLNLNSLSIGIKVGVSYQF